MTASKINIKVNPKLLFLIDSIGALLSAVMLGFVLASFERTFGVSYRVLYCLSFAACVCCIYSFFCFLYARQNWRPCMKLLGIINLSYCGVTIGLIIYLQDKVTAVGIIYFALEILIIASLAILELRTAIK